MIEKVKGGAIVALAIVLAFAFGWCANGYKIYAQDFGYKAQVMDKLK
jgi:hypothetical protein